MGVYDQAELYRLAFEGPVDAEVEWLLATVGTEVTSVLEPFCGVSRYANAFAERAIRFHGIDLSTSMLAHAPRGPGRAYTVADAADFDLGETFDLGWCPINSIAHLAGDELVRGHLRCMRAHVGVYVFELELVRWDGDWTDATPERSEWTVPQGDGTEIQAIVSRQSCDVAARTCAERAEYRRLSAQGRVIEESVEDFTMRMWTFEDLIELTAQHGFEVDSVFCNLGSRGRPRVELSPDLENDGNNYFFVLR